VEVAGAAAEEAAAVASAGAQTGGVEETGEREKSSCGGFLVGGWPDG